MAMELEDVEFEDVLEHVHDPNVCLPMFVDAVQHKIGLVMYEPHNEEMNHEPLIREGLWPPLVGAWEDGDLHERFADLHDAAADLEDDQLTIHGLQGPQLAFKVTVVASLWRELWDTLQARILMPAPGGEARSEQVRRVWDRVLLKKALDAMALLLDSIMEATQVGTAIKEFVKALVLAIRNDD